MSLITLDELARGAVIAIFGGAAGVCTLAFPGSAVWLLPAGLCVGGCALTVPEIRGEVARAWPALADGAQQARHTLTDRAWQLPGVARPATHPDVVGDDNGDGAAEGRTVRLHTPTAQASRPQPRGPRLLTPQEFAADPLFQAVDEPPHRFVIGHSQGGKSTVLHGMARAWVARGEPVLVCDPDAARGQWPGCKVAGYAEDYRGIAQLLDQVRDEFDARSALYADGQRDFAPLHLVLDEVHETFREIPGAREFVLETLGRRGAKRGIRVTMGTQDNHKGSLGLESAGVLDNFVTAEVEVDERGRRVATVYRGNAGRKKHARQYQVPPLPGAKTFITPRRAAVAADAPRPETVSVRVPERQGSPEALLATLMAELPADVRATVPDISPERAGRLAQILGGQQTATVARVERGEGGDLYIIAAAAADGGTGRGGAGREDKSAYYQALAALYEAAGSEGRTFDSVYEVHKGTKNIVFPAWQRGHAQWRESAGNAGNVRSSRSQE